MGKQKRTMSVDEEIHAWVKGLADKSGVSVVDVMRHMYHRYHNEVSMTDFNQLKLRRDMEMLNQRKAAIQKEEQRLIRMVDELKEKAG